MTWRELFDRGDDYDVTAGDVAAALRERRDDR